MILDFFAGCFVGFVLGALFGIVLIALLAANDRGEK